MTEISYYHCRHCTEQIALEVKCPACGVGKAPLPNQNSLKDFFMWLKVHREGRKHLYKKLRDRLDFGYVRACDVIEAELQRIIEEHKDDSDRITADTEPLD